MKIRNERDRSSSGGNTALFGQTLLRIRDKNAATPPTSAMPSARPGPCCALAARSATDNAQPGRVERQVSALG